MKSRATGLAIGGVVGALLGLLVAWILLEEAEGTEVGPGGVSARRRRGLQPTDAINLTLSTIGVARQIASLRQR